MIRFHILAVPHTISTPEYSACAFTQKVVKLCAMLKARGHVVIHYGHEASEIACDENVTVTRDEDLRHSYGDHDWRRQGFPAYSFDDHVYKVFFARTIAALYDRKQSGDFLLLPFGANHKPVADAHPDLIACESGIGYPGGGFAPYRVFESYAALHAYRGVPAIESMANDMWYDAVIPNAYDLADFEFSAEKDDYFLFLGRVNAGKGVHVAVQIVEEIGGRLVIAGPGALGEGMTRSSRPTSDYVTLAGVVGPKERKRLLSRAKAVLAPSMFLEPFCGVHIEAMLSGTPVITSDWGAFAEYNLHGVTGWRCKTFEQFVWAARNVDRIRPAACREWAERNFSLDRVGAMYDEYFHSVRDVFGGQGWYEPHPERAGLEGLMKYYPSGG